MRKVIRLTMISVMMKTPAAKPICAKAGEGK
jgi:hypothetical protein